MRNYYPELYTHPIYLLFAAILLSTITICLLLSYSYKIGLIDKPGGRKKHGQNVPLIGGIAIYISITILLAPLFLQKIQYFAFWIATFLLVITCVLDDLKTIKVKHRFLMQSLSIVILMFFGQTIIFNLGDLAFIGQINLGWLSIPFTIFTLIGVINAVNMMDGIDGITGCVSLVELILLGGLAAFIGAKFELVVIITLIGAILAFLVFNFPNKLLKRKIFLGDAGSMLIGLILAWLTVKLTQGNNKIPPVLMLWIMALPLMDTVHLIVNRKARGLSPFKADRRHIHHILLQLNYSQVQTPLIIMSTALAVGATGVLLFINGVSEGLLFLGIILIFIIYLSASIYLKRKVVKIKIKTTSLKNNKSTAVN